MMVCNSDISSVAKFVGSCGYLNQNFFFQDKVEPPPDGRLPQATEGKAVVREIAYSLNY